MKFAIENINNEKFYIELINEDNQKMGFHIRFLVDMLNIDEKKYYEIIKNNNCMNEDVYSYNCYFKNEEDVQRVIDALEPYLIMSKLTG